MPQLGYTSGRNSYWLANVARLLDAILTPGQRIETLVMEGPVTERTISYQYCKTSPSPTLVADTRHTRHTCHRHSSTTLVTLVTLVTDTRHTRHTCHRHWSPTLVTLVTIVTLVTNTRHRHSSPTLVTGTRHTRHTRHRHSSPILVTRVTLVTDTGHRHS